jgi:hypothetical protein
MSLMVMQRGWGCMDLEEGGGDPLAGCNGGLDKE